MRYVLQRHYRIRSRRSGGARDRSGWSPGASSAGYSPGEAGIRCHCESDSDRSREPAVVDVESVVVRFDNLTACLLYTSSVGHEELKRSGVFVLPGFAKFVVVNKAARLAHEGINPFTKEKQLFAAKPESRTVKASPVKVLKDAVA